MRFELHDRLCVAPTQLSTRVEEAVVLLDLQRGRYYSLQQVAGTIWTLLEQPRTLAELLGELGRRYDVEAAVCRADTEELLGQLVERGLVTVSSAAH